MPATRSIKKAKVLFTDWLSSVSYGNYEFILMDRAGCIYMQARFTAPDCDSGLPGLQYTRQWMLHPDMTKSEVVQTAFKLVLTSVEHEARENFTYGGRRIFGPHYNVDSLHAICEPVHFQHR